jgi:hypothetical protein
MAALTGGGWGPLSGELACYGRSVVHQEWPQMEDGHGGDTINPGQSPSSTPSSLVLPAGPEASQR